MPHKAMTHNPHINPRKGIRQHGGKRPDSFYLSARWRKARLLVLRERPLCADPWGDHRFAGQVVAATDVDHIVARELAPELAFTSTNLQSLCHSCHSRKTRLEGRQPVERRTQ